MGPIYTTHMGGMDVDALMLCLDGERKESKRKGQLRLCLDAKRKESKKKECLRNKSEWKESRKYDFLIVWY